MEEKRKSVSVHVTICNKNAKLPFYANPGDAGMDIVAADDVVIYPGETKLVPTGIKVAIPEGYEIQIRPRSGLSYSTPLRVPNSPGTIDCGFRDEIKVLIENTSSNINEEPNNGSFCTVDTKNNVNGVYKIFAGDRIAQMVLNKVPCISWEKVKSVDDIGSDRGGGFGSSGKRI